MIIAAELRLRQLLRNSRLAPVSSQFLWQPDQMRADNLLAAMKDWEIIADNIHKAGWSLGWVSALDLEGRTIWIVDAHSYGKRFIVRADEMLTAFLELQRTIHEFAVDLIS
jgi:hypothetical protein